MQRLIVQMLQFGGLIMDNYLVILYDGAKPMTAENAQQFFVTKEKWLTLSNELTEILVGNRGRWRISERYSFFQATMICNYHYLVLKLAFIDSHETISYQDKIVEYCKKSEVF